MVILVTGGRGQLGQSLAKIASAYPQHRFLFTDMPEADITDKSSMDRLLEESCCEAIINCAAYTAVDKAEDDVELARRINIDGPAVLACLAYEKNIPLIHISTDYVFDGEGNTPLKETDQPCPDSVYGITKLAGEEMIRKSGCRYAIIRTAWLYSEFGGNFAKTMLRLGKEKDSLGVVFDQIGTPTYAPDLAKAIMGILESGPDNSIYHFSNEGAVSWYDFAKAIFDIAGINIRVDALTTDQYPSKAKRPSYSVLNKSLIKSRGVAVPYWRDSLAQMIKTYLNG